MHRSTTLRCLQLLRPPGARLLRLSAAWMLTASLPMYGCQSGSDSAPGATPRAEDVDVGSMELRVGYNGAHGLKTLSYRVLRQGQEVRTGTVQLGSSGSFSFQVPRLPAAPDYTLELEAVSEDGSVKCSARADFSIAANETTLLSIQLNCKKNGDEGDLDVNGSLNHCPEIQHILAEPGQAVVGASIRLSASALDPDGDDLSVQWTQGTTVLSSTPEAQFPCAQVGSYEVSVEFKDAACADIETLQLTCVDPAIPAICGNGTVEFPEACDDGNTVNNDGCSSTCEREILRECGNGIVEEGEECDDGNNEDNDGCSAKCEAEDPLGCGNGIVEEGEECDDGNNEDGDGCSATCRVESPPSVCGNGIVEIAEQCDDGNTEDGDGCSAKCEIEVPIECGNGKLELGEQCDDGNTVDGDGCSANCTIELPIQCGNSIVEAGEECDDGNTVDGDGCSANCTIELPIQCGNGIVEAGEECDDGNEIDGDGCENDCTVTPARADCGVCLARSCTLNAFNLDLVGRCGPDNSTCRSLLSCAARTGCAQGPLGLASCYCGSVEDLAYCGNPASGLTPDGACKEAVETAINSTSPTNIVNALASGWGAQYAVASASCIVSSCGNECLAAFATCGNGKVEAGEACDDGNQVNGDGCENECFETVASVCGDGKVEGREVCDDGNEVDNDGCPNNCAIRYSPRCGNGRLEYNEQCDDGNNLNKDGCTDRCRIEPLCGNGRLELGEQCDDNNLSSGDGCSSNCTIESVCGNGTLEPGEACDDGNQDNADGCSASCNLEAANACNDCIESNCHRWSYGDDLQARCAPDDEDCQVVLQCAAQNDCFDDRLGLAACYCGSIDDLAYCTNTGNGLEPDGACRETIENAANSRDRAVVMRRLQDASSPPARAAIAASCIARRCGRDCMAAYSLCGNGNVDPGEACDDGNRVDGDGCDNSCLPSAPSVCGNGLVERGESCDDGNVVNGDGCRNDCRQTESISCGDGNLDRYEWCDDGNNLDGDGCSRRCELEPYCGNGKHELSEQCDDGNTEDGDGCSSDCTLEHVCGDGVQDQGERCDDGNTESGDGCSDQCQLEGASACGYCIAEQCNVDAFGSEITDFCGADDASCRVILECAARTGCSTGPLGLLSCYCGGIEDQSYCSNAASGLEPDGACKAVIENAVNSQDRNRVVRTLTNASGPAGQATWATRCIQTRCSASCLESFVNCGNGTLEDGELCDDGNTENNDDCSNLCLPKVTELCGNGLVEGDEACDDGNFNNNDECLNNCRFRNSRTCGDGDLDRDEQCDDGNRLNGDGCSQWCTIEPLCGNGLFELGEQCDDGNTENGDGCSQECAFEPVCGNGELEPGEQCDPGTGVDDPQCDDNCQLVFPWSCGTCLARNCDHAAFRADTLEICGTDNEACRRLVGCAAQTGCDQGPLGMLSCYCGDIAHYEDCRAKTQGDPTINGACREVAETVLNTREPRRIVDGLLRGSTSGAQAATVVSSCARNYCDASCVGLFATCGNGQVDENEQCDDGNRIDGDGCERSCMLTVASVCGNGIVEGNEACDDGDNNTSNECTNECRIRHSWRCGNGRIEFQELCDDGNTLDGDGCSSVCLPEPRPQPAGIREMAMR